QGAGAALMIPGSLALLAATFGEERRGRAIGTWSAGTIVATALGPVLGGALAHAGWWRGVFFLNLPLAAAALWLLGRVPGTLAGALILTLLVYSAFYGLLLFLPLHLIQAQGYDVALAGLTQLPIMLLLVALSRPAGALLDRRGPRLPLTLGPAVAATGFLLL